MPEPSDRGENLAKRKATRDEILKLYTEIQKSFEASQDRVTEIEANWKMFTCNLTHNQLYNGRNELYFPVIYSAVNARATRFLNQLFPKSDRHVECVTLDGTLPRAAIAVCEHYIGTTNLRQLMGSLCVAGDLEGQYNIYVSWVESSRYPIMRVLRGVDVEGFESEQVEDILEEEEMLGGPHVEVLSDADVNIWPITNDSVDGALATGGAVTIIRRWSKAKIRQLRDEGEIDDKIADEVLEDMDKVENGVYRFIGKSLANSAGIKKGSEGTWLLVYEIWTELEIDKDEKRLCQIYMASKSRILMARRNPLWSDKCPLLSVPVEKMPGVAKGVAPVSQVAKLQYYATDVLNETADSATYSLVPIIFRDPASNTAPLTLAPGAVWDVAPSMVQFAQFPPLYQEGLDLLENIKQQIMQVLSVNPAAITQLTSRKKMNQAEVAQEQQIDILTTADAVTVLEDGILSPLVSLFMDLDYQYREKDLTVRQFGQTGIGANLEKVSPLESGSKYSFRWSGVEVSRSQQQQQQKIAALNILKSIPPQAYPGYTLNVEPIIMDIVESVYGPQQGRLVFKDLRSQISIDPEKENALMDMGHSPFVHPMDDHQEHIASHQQSMQLDGDPSRLKMVHIQEHVLAMSQMAQAQQQAMQPQGEQQGPGARPGAQPSQGRPAQQPPGQIGQDQLGRGDPTVFPRKVG
ncbi:MAG: hypothetical protein C5B60_01570 [Chloroflexi bacterium]|nr:MAG: hypothetical protein C5B60_01570 [Chloroflexota bacterium]